MSSANNLQNQKSLSDNNQVAATADNVINWPGLTAAKEISQAGVGEWLVPLSLMIMDYLAILLAISLAHVAAGNFLCQFCALQ